MPRSPQAGRQLSIWLPRDVDDEVSRIAQDEALTASAVVRRAITREVRARRRDKHDKAAS